MAKITIYLDKGASPLAYRQLRHFLQKLGHNCERINAEQVINGSWEENTDIFAIGGGADVPYHNKLTGVGCTRIRRFVEDGGTYLGICAGAYFGASSISFDKEGPLEVIEKRELSFFPNIAVGPAYPTPAYDPIHSTSARIAPIHWLEKWIIPAFFDGGCYFKNAHLQPNVKILARYIALPGEPAAAVHCTVKRGKAILCGAHPEYSSHLLSKKDHLLAMQATLDQSETNRLAMFSEILKYKN